jgi:hypothetical protein
MGMVGSATRPRPGSRLAENWSNDQAKGNPLATGPRRSTLTNMSLFLPEIHPQPVEVNLFLMVDGGWMGR